MEDFQLTEPITEVIMNFLRSPEGRTRDVVPSLITLIGYIAALPAQKYQEIFQTEGTRHDKVYGLALFVLPNLNQMKVSEGGAKRVAALMVAMVCETVRRAARHSFKDYSEKISLGVLRTLVSGAKAQGIPSACNIVS